MADFFHAMGVLCSRDLLQCGILPLMKEQTPQKVQFVTVDADVAGQRIDNFLRTQLKGVPKSMIYRILRKGEVRVNKGRIKPEYKLADGDVVRIPPVRVSEGARTSCRRHECRWQLCARRRAPSSRRSAPSRRTRSTRPSLSPPSAPPRPRSG